MLHHCLQDAATQKKNRMDTFPQSSAEPLAELLATADAADMLKPRQP
jgi:hypothetical protein